MLNNITIAGRLTKDPEINYTQNGKAVANYRLAVQRPFTNQQGEREADFFNVVTWGKTAENLSNNIGKGELVGVEGRLQSRSYENKDGQKVFVTEIVSDQVSFLEPKGNKKSQNQNQENQSQPAEDDNPFGGQTVEITDDMLPF